MRHLKKPDVAGLFYPDHEVELNQLLDQFLDSSGNTSFPKKLASLNIPHEVITYSNSGHGFLTEDYNDMFIRIFNFIDKYTKWKKN